jgi:H+/Cl- antiporter ClcA
VVGERKLSREQEGVNVFIPSMLLLLTALGAWLLLDPLRSLAEDNSTWLAAIPEAVAVGIFVGAVSSVFMQNIPMKFMDGYKLIQWSKLAWAVQAGLAAFLFWHVMINTSRSDFNAVNETAPAVAIIAMAVCFLVTVALYTFFRFRQAMVGSPA